MASRCRGTGGGCWPWAGARTASLVIDTATDRVTGEVAVAQPHNGTLSRDGSIAWVGSQQQGATALVRLDLTAGKETARVALDKTPARPRGDPGRHARVLHAGRSRRDPGARHREQSGRRAGPGRRVSPPRALHRRRPLGSRGRPGPRRAGDPGHRGRHGGRGGPGGQGPALEHVQLRRPHRLRDQRGHQ